MSTPVCFGPLFQLAGTGFVTGVVNRSPKTAMSFWNRQRAEEEAYAQNSALRGRLYFLQLVVIIAMSALLYRVFWLQQVQGGDFIEQVVKSLLEIGMHHIGDVE